MQAIKELRRYGGGEKVWAGKYKNSQNLMHWHYDCELIYAECGKLEVFCDGERYNLEKGQAFFIGAKKTHCLHAATPDTLLATIVFDGGIIAPFAGELDLESPVLSKVYGIDEVYGKLLKTLKEKPPFYSHFAACTVALTMMEIFSGEPTKPRAAEKETGERLKRLFDETDKKLRYFTFEEAAAFMCMSPAYFSRFFHNAVGATFSDYLNAVKIERAVHILQTETDKPMSVVSDECGFATIRNFNRTFKKLTGYSPRDLPKEFRTDGLIFRTESGGENPTLNDCTLIEASDM